MVHGKQVVTPLCDTFSISIILKCHEFIKMQRKSFPQTLFECLCKQIINAIYSIVITAIQAESIIFEILNNQCYVSKYMINAFSK